MGWWDRHVVPRIVDRACSDVQLDDARERATRGLRGRVLEIGFGSGTSCGFLPPAVDELLAVEPSDVAWERSAGRRADCTAAVRRVGLDGSRVDVGSGSVDAVLVAFTLCTVDDPAAVLAEARRVLRPDGSLHLVEHGLAPDVGVVRWQRRLDGLQQRLFGGCHLTRDPVEALAQAGFATGRLDQGYLPVPSVGRPWAFVTTGVATATTVGDVDDEEMT